MRKGGKNKLFFFFNRLGAKEQEKRKKLEGYVVQQKSNKAGKKKKKITKQLGVPRHPQPPTWLRHWICGGGEANEGAKLRCITKGDGQSLKKGG
jgi:hypothetical protein